MANTTYGSPYVQSSDLVSGWPATSLSVADRIDDVSFKGNGVNDQTASYTGVLLDAGKTVVMNVATSNTFTIPTAASVAYENGTIIRVTNKGAGTTTVQPNGGVTLNGGNVTLLQYQSVIIQLVASNVWNVVAKPAPTAVSSGLTLITTSTFSAASTVSVNNCFTSTYENYLIVTTQDSAGINVQLRLRASGTDNSTSNYLRTGAAFNTSGYSEFGGGTGQSFWYLGNTDGGSVSQTTIYRPQLATKTGMTNLLGNGLPNSFYTTGQFTQTTQFDGFTMFYSSASNTGTLRVYGYSNS